MLPRSHARTGFVSFALFVAATALAQAGEPTAEDKDRARGLFFRGDELYQAGDYPGALEAFRAAHALVGAPTTGLELGRTLAALGRLLEARDVLLGVAGRPPASGDDNEVLARARAEAQALAAQIGERLPRLTLELRVSASAAAVARVTIDGQPLDAVGPRIEREIDPGRHVVEATGPGLRPAAAAIDLGERERRWVVLVLEPEAMAAPAARPAAAAVPAAPVAPPPEADPSASSLSPLVPIGFAVAGVGILAGIVTGAVSLSEAASAREHCDAADRCSAEAEPFIERGTALAHVSTASFVVGAVGAALGVYGLFSPRDPPSPATLGAVAGGAGLAWRW
jgi:hypothetical protein